MGEYAVRQTNGVDTAQRLRLAGSVLVAPTSGLGSRSGVVGLGVGAASGMSRQVGTGRALIQGTSSSLQGVYEYVLDSAKTVTFDDGGATARVDLIVVRVWENASDASGQTKAEVVVVKGTPGAGAPTPPASSVVLYSQPIPVNASAGTAMLPPMPTAAGGVAQCGSDAERDALVTYNGLVIYRTDLNRFQGRQGGSWVTLPGTIALSGADVITASGGSSLVSAKATILTATSATLAAILSNTTLVAGAQSKLVGVVPALLRPSGLSFVPIDAVVPGVGAASGLLDSSNGEVTIRWASAAVSAGNLFLSGTWPL